MMTLPKIDRRTWLAIWAQGRRRNRLRFAPPALLPAPVLRAAYPTLLQWDWDLPNPFKWNVWLSWDNGASWMMPEDYWHYGNSRQFAPDGGSEFYFIVGVDAAGVEITERSNWIRPDDAVPPVPQSVIGLQLWTRVESLAGMADGDRVTTWPDESGHETHLAQSNFDYRPVYRSNDLGQPAVMFDGTDDLLTSVASVFKPDQHTIFVVALPLATGENDILGTGGSGDGDTLLMLYGNHLRGHAWRGSDANSLDGSTPINAPAVAVFEQVVSETDITLRLDGSDEAMTVMSGTPANTRKWVTLGSRSTGMNFSGYILAVLVYDRALTPTEANTIRQYLIDTYAVPVPYPAVTLQTDLAGYWTLDEAEGFSRNDSSGNAWDLGEWSFQEATGGSYRPIYQVSGVLNDAADFGDESGGEGLVSFAPNSLLAGDFTFSCWINYNTTSGFDGQGVISVGGTVQIGIRAYDGAVNFTVPTDTSPGYCQALTGYGSIYDYNWTHAVFVKEGNSLRIYLNGDEQAYADFTGNIVPTAAGFFGASDLILGINPWGYPLIGALDEVGCWQRALSADEVLQLYNYGSGLPFENF